jgi:hypothetical protein
LNNSLGEFNPDPSVQGRLQSFQNSIEQLLWPEKREKDELLGDKIPGKIDRTTETSYLKVPYGYLPDALQKLKGIRRFFPAIIDDNDKSVQIGPIPKGTPVGLLSNINLLSESADPNERIAHDKALLDLIAKISGDLAALPPSATDDDAKKVFANVVDQMLALSKCPDLIVNRGHYFGTGGPAGGDSGLSDADKKALIAYMKRF